MVDLHFFVSISLGERYVHTVLENTRLDASKNEHGERNVRRNVGHSGAKMQMNRLRHEIGMAPQSLVTRRQRLTITAFLFRATLVNVKNKTGNMTLSGV